MEKLYQPHKSVGGEEDGYDFKSKFIQPRGTEAPPEEQQVEERGERECDRQVGVVTPTPRGMPELEDDPEQDRD